jgi:cell division protein FtsL
MNAIDKIRLTSSNFKVVLASVSLTTFPGEEKMTVQFGALVGLIALLTLALCVAVILCYEYKTRMKTWRKMSTEDSQEIRWQQKTIDRQQDQIKKLIDDCEEYESRIEVIKSICSGINPSQTSEEC